MRKLNKINIWTGGIMGSWMALSWGSVQIITDTKGTTTTIIVNYDGKSEEEVKLNKAGNNWQLVSKELLADEHFDLTQPTLAKFAIDGIELKLKPTLDLYVQGSCEGSLCIDHPHKVIIEKNQTLEVEESFFLNRAILFENAGTLKVDRNWICLLTSIKNSGTMIVKQGWQVMSLQTFESAASGKFTMQRADIVSPGTKITNKGQINCILDFNGGTCDFTNHAGEVRVGGNATLNSLVNKSETEPVVGDFKEVKREFFDTKGKVIDLTKASGPYHQTLTLYHLKLGHTCEECRTDRGSGQQYIGYVRKIFYNQEYKIKEGKRSFFHCNGALVLQINSICLCSDMFIGKDLKLINDLKIHAYANNTKEVKAIWTCTSMRSWHGRGYFCDSFVDKNTIINVETLIPTHIEVLGTVTGKVETFVNGKADKAQPGVVKAVAANFEQYQQKLDEIAQGADICSVLFNLEEYTAELQALKANPVFATMVQLQERRKPRSELSSTLPSRQGSPTLN